MVTHCLTTKEQSLGIVLFCEKIYFKKERGGRMNYIIGMDIGTTASKGVLYRENGEIIEELSIPLSLDSGKK